MLDGSSNSFMLNDINSVKIIATEDESCYTRKDST